ncbi:MAG: hypothetical protein IT580_10970, partial [Verrucomicrobiales bacterium]|nr:hypothetical protein [Verrucomicrobiales bacterium]
MATLRARILTGFAAVTLAGTATAWWLSERFASSLVDRHAALLAGDKAALVSRYFQAENPVWEEWFTDAFYTRAHGYSFTYFDRHGVEGGHSANRPYAVPLSDQARTRPNPHDAAWIERLNQPEPAVVAVYPIYIVRGGHHVTGWVQTLVPLAPQRAGFAWFRVGFATLTAASLGLGALALLALMRPWSRAVSIAAESARHWTPDRTEQAPLLTPRNAPELQPLVDGLNSLLARISDRQRQQQQFLADASHELRTPLTILRG